MQRLHRGGGDRHEMVGRREPAFLQHGLEVFLQDFRGDRLAHFLGQSGAALVVAQRAEALAQRGKNAVPAVERAAHLVQQHDRWPVAAKLEVNADAVGVHPGHGLPPWLRGIETWMPANFNMATATARPGCHRPRRRRCSGHRTRRDAQSCTQICSGMCRPPGFAGMTTVDWDLRWYRRAGSTFISTSFRRSTVRRSMRRAGAPPSASIRTGRPQLALDLMDACGIEVALTSLAQPGVGFCSEAGAQALARRCNDYAAELAARWPRRFGAFATVPMGTVQGALDEIAYALDVLKLDGVSLFASYGENFLGDPRFDPRAGDAERAQRGRVRSSRSAPIEQGSRAALAGVHDGISVRHHARGGEPDFFRGDRRAFRACNSFCPMPAGWCPISPGGFRSRR